MYNFVKNPEDEDRPATLIYWAAKNGHMEIVKILAPLTDNPNAPNNWGETPSSVAENKEIRRFLKSFNSSRKRNAGPLAETPMTMKRDEKF